MPIGTPHAITVRRTQPTQLVAGAFPQASTTKRCRLKNACAA